MKPTGDSLYDEISSLYKSHNYTLIINKLASIDNITQRNPAASFILAGALFQVGDFQKSLDILVDLEASFSQSSEYWNLSGSCSRRLQRLAYAQHCFKRALQLSPNSIEIKNNFGNLLVDLECFDEAIQSFKDILKINPSYHDAQSNLNRASFLKSQSSSINNSSKSFTTNNVFDPLLQAFSVNESMRTMGAPEIKLSKSASDLVSKATPAELAAQIDQTADKIKLARKAFDEGNFTFALELCSQAFQHSGPSAILFVLLSDIYISLQRYSEAEFFLLQSLLYEKPTSNIYINLITLARLRSDTKSANKLLELLASFEPGNVHIKALSDSLSEDATATNHLNFIDQLSYIKPSLPSIKKVS